MLRHKKLTFFEPFIFFAKCRCERKVYSNSMNHLNFDCFLMHHLLSNKVVQKTCCFYKCIQNFVAWKSYVLWTTQLNHFNSVKYGTMHMGNVRSINCLRGKNVFAQTTHDFWAVVFCQIWCGTKNSRFLTHFFPCKMVWRKKITFFWTAKWCGIKNSCFVQNVFFC